MNKKMKKLLITLFLCLALFACSNTNSTNEKTQLNEIEISSYPVDMSGYKGISSTRHNFKGISPSEIIRIIEEKGSAIIYMGFDGCHVCQEAAKYINEVAEELEVTVYYLNCADPKYPLSGKIYNQLMEKLDPILDTNKAGQKTIFTPHVFTIENGELKNGHISVVDSWEDGRPSEDSVNELKAIYKDLMANFVK